MDQDHRVGPTRREAFALMGAAGATLAAGPVLGQTAPASGFVSGIVYEARRGAGRRQADDPGLAGVLVSNGREVVRTDSGGRYNLPMGDEGVVFVIKPSGYTLPTDENNLPRFSYVHQPTGSPADLGLRYHGVDPSGPLPASVDFGLRRVEEPAAFDVILFTDPQPESHAELDFVRDTAMTSVAGTKAAFGMTTVNERTVLAIYFDKNNKVADKALYSAKDGKVFTIEGRKTPSYGEDKSFITSLIESI